MDRPRRRSKMRRALGSLYYTVRKMWYWYLSGITFAERQSKTLPVAVFSHRTPLLRKLRDVDMQMQRNKITNLRIAVDQLNGIVIRPGEIFSYWRQIGNPTRRKGYVDGMILRDGKVISGVGGGLCQLSNLIFWMTIHTPLTVTERWRHGYDVFPDVKRDQPFGSGATCSYPAIDLQIRNDTDQSFQLALHVGDEYLEGSWRSEHEIDVTYKVIEREHIVQHELFGQYSRNNKIFREILGKRSGEVMGEELVAENHALMMYSPLVESMEVSE